MFSQSQRGMLSPSQIGSRLRKARERCAISPKEAADALGLLPADVNSLESGQREISAREITKLADIYHYPATYFFLEDGTSDLDDLSVVLHQEFFEREFAPAVRVGLWRLFDLYGEVTVLRGMLNRSVKLDLPDYRTGRANELDCPSQEGKFAAEEESEFVTREECVAREEGECVAREERRRLCLENQPIPSVARLISDQGIWTAATKLPAGLSGLFVNHSDVGLVILVNQRDSSVRRRFSYLHEFAHALFDRSDSFVIMTKFIWNTKPNDPVEIRADAFAEAFLMPKEDVVEQLEKLDRKRPILHRQMSLDSASNAQSLLGSKKITYQDIAILAHHFGVSYEAAVVRLINLKFISSTEKNAFNQKEKTGKEYIKLLVDSGLLKSSKLSETSERKLRNHIRCLAFEAFEKKQISRGRLMEIGRKINVDRYKMLESPDVTNLID